MPVELTRAIDRFAAALEANTESSQQIVSAIHETERRRKRSAILTAVAGILALVMIAAIFLTLASITNTQNVIKDCTDKTRSTATCARKGEQNTAKVVAAIVQGELATNYVTQLCAKREFTESAFTQCVQDELANVKSGKRKLPQLP